MDGSVSSVTQEPLYCKCQSFTPDVFTHSTDVIFGDNSTINMKLKHLAVNHYIHAEPLLLL